MRLALLLGTSLLIGCTSTVTPPERVGEVVDAVEVGLVQDARHVGLLLPDSGSGEGFVEFGFGEWGWYVEERDAWYDAFATVLVPTQGALGRAERRASDLDEVRRRNPRWTVRDLVVSRAAAEALLTRLEARFRAGGGRPTWQPRYGFEFVRTTDSYWAGRTCADVVAEWCRELGCDVGWAPVRIALDVAPGRR